MKSTRILVIFALVFGFVGNVSADLVAHYEFEGNADDSSGNNLHGTFMGDAVIVPDGERGFVLNLDGNGDYVDCGNDSIFDITDTITVAAWIKVSEFDKNWQAIVTKSSSAWRMQRDSSSNNVGFYCAVVQGNQLSAISTMNMNDGQWHHIAGVYNGSIVSLYVDGILESSENAVRTINTNTEPVMIGENAGSSGRFFNGMIDDVRIYNNAISPPEIAAIIQGDTGTGGGMDFDWIISGANMSSGVSGNIGIGTANPEYKLDVIGDSEDPIVSVLNEGEGDALYGEGFDGAGVVGASLNYAGVVGMSVLGPGVVGTGALAPGVQGMNILTGAYGDLGDRDGVYGECSGGYAGYFEGDVRITGRVSKGSGTFQIDHPLDPENKYLQHSFVESPDMMNIYNGCITLNEAGQATVKLPEWFEALNKDFRYQLTCIGGFAPVYIAEKISENRFKIAGGKPGMEVSWQVTGIRHDPYAVKYRVAVEENKSSEEKGYYLHPEAYGLTKERSIETVRNPRHSKIRELAKKQ